MKVFGRRDLSTEPARAPNSTPPVEGDAAGARTFSLREQVLQQIDPNIASALSPTMLQREIEHVINEIANEERVGLTAREQTRMAEELAHDMVGLGPLEPLLRDD